jgi:hypothetical protein
MRTPLHQPNLPAILLRVGLAIVLAYAAISSFVSPEDWVGYFPEFMTDLVDSDLLLKLFSVFELGLAAWLLSGWRLELAGIACAAMFSGIVAANLALLEITFRDIGLVFASLALAVIAWQRKQTKVDAAFRKP